MERLSAEGHFFHRECFCCSICATTLRLATYAFDCEEGNLGDGAALELASRSRAAGGSGTPTTSQQGTQHCQESSSGNPGPPAVEATVPAGYQAMMAPSMAKGFADGVSFSLATFRVPHVAQKITPGNLFDTSSSTPAMWQAFNK